MILDKSININDFTSKKPHYYSETLQFIPIFYKKEPFKIQTPPLYIPFGIQTSIHNSTKQHLDLSFQNYETNDAIISFLTNKLHPCFTFINDKYKEKYKVTPFIKESRYSQWMRFKINTSTCLYFNQEKQQIDFFPSKCFGTFIIYLSGCWIQNNNLFFHWSILQAKLILPIYLTNYSFIDDEIDTKKKIPVAPPLPPPPPPPIDKYKKMIQIGVSKQAVEQKKQIDRMQASSRIQASDLQNVILKKTKKDISLKETSINNDDFCPSLDEIQKALRDLQKIK
tara:strand:- start:114 stop:959 length:846 start_codon:yes stop_codon:yes gene_type:complete